jgi:glycine/D-amino acid oxidase-like deaminating enzyme
MLSFWEKDHFLNYDHIIVGGGIVGLSTAIALKEQRPSKTVLVLEKGIFPTGASTKNAGFSCFGSLTEILADLKILSDDEVVELVELRWKGLQLLRQRLGEEAMDYQQNGGYELLADKQSSAINEIDRVNQLLYPLFDDDVYSLADDKVKDFGFDASRIDHLVYNSFEGQIHTGKMMKSLQSLAASLEVEILTGVSVMGIDESDSEVQIAIGGGIQFKGRNVAICTNAFSKELFPELPLNPGRGSVLVTKPIPGLKFEGTFHYDEGYYYFRNYQDRILFGGGRNLNFEAEQTTEFEVRTEVMNKLRADLKDLIIPDTPFEIEQTWSGIMAFGENKQPILKKHSSRVFMGLRLGGMGVAIGSQLGLQLSEMMLTSE